MTHRLTLFSGTLVQDSALSVSGVDRGSAADRPFSILDGKPVLFGSGLKGAAVAMARRFFHPFPRFISEDAQAVQSGLRRSLWDFPNSTLPSASPSLRAGVGILQKTSARAEHVLYDREVIPAGTRWPVLLRVDWSWALSQAEAERAEQILGYVLAAHWAEGRCWLGGDVARGLGWCHLEDLKAHRLTATQYQDWAQSNFSTLPDPLPEIPRATPSKPWTFRTRTVTITFGPYRPEGPDQTAWGLDMLSVGPHSSERTVQSASADAHWAQPAWSPTANPIIPTQTDHAILTENARPLLPGASVRGPLRHAFSRASNAAGKPVIDPHTCQGDVGETDPAGLIFGTTSQSSRLLIRDAHAHGAWSAALLHMHAEDEFTAGSYGSAKRDAIRLLEGSFPVTFVVEGDNPEEVGTLTAAIDKLIALGKLAHLPVGGHKTRGAGWGHWNPDPAGWLVAGVLKDTSPEPDCTPAGNPTPAPNAPKPPQSAGWGSYKPAGQTAASITCSPESHDIPDLTLALAAQAANAALPGATLSAWWCEPTIDLNVSSPPPLFGRQWPGHNNNLRIDEAVFFFPTASFRIARTATGVKSVLIREHGPKAEGATPAQVLITPARLLANGQRFAASLQNESKRIFLRQWLTGGAVAGFTLQFSRQENPHA